MNLHRYPHLVDLLAAEYALGTLRGGARRRLQTCARGDAVLRRALLDWEQRLAPMAELAPESMPSPQVWALIERRLGLGSAASASAASSAAASTPAPVRPAGARAPRRLFDSLAFWRGWAVAVTALAAIALVVALRPLFAPGPPAGAPPATLAQQGEAAFSHVAVLAGKTGKPVLLVAWDEAHDTMSVHRVGKVDLPPGKAMELWGLPASGHPVALGMMPDSGNGTLPARHARPEGYAALAISIENPGGSPNPNGPSGPVVLSGKLLPVT
jgi:anti-sigma-K factor RskA